jgi:hypothetical protein
MAKFSERERRWENIDGVGTVLHIVMQELEP